MGLTRFSQDAGNSDDVLSVAVEQVKDPESVVVKIKEHLGEHFEQHYVKRKNRVYVTVRKEAVRKCAKFIFESLGARLSTVTCVDKNFRFELIYHFTFDNTGLVLNIKCLIPKYEPKVESVSEIIFGANWIEREIKDLFGVEFVGHPNPERLILSDDWPENEYPLRRRLIE